MTGNSRPPSISSEIDFFTGYDKTKLIQRLIECGVTIRTIIVPRSSRYEKHVAPMVGLANTLKIPIIKVGTKDKFANIPSLERTTILLSARFPLAIPRSIFNRYQFAFNVHPTLLPKYRGRYLEPILINGERESGVTIHLIDDEYDSGPIVGQSKYPIGRFDTVATLIRKAEQLEFELIIEALENCQSSSFEMKLQDQSQASFFFTKRTPNDSFIPCTTSLKDALTIVRACDLDSHPAFTIIDDEKVVLSMRRPVKPPDQHDCI